jgi:hypothetical protein
MDWDGGQLVITFMPDGSQRRYDYYEPPNNNMNTNMGRAAFTIGMQAYSTSARVSIYCVGSLGPGAIGLISAA